MSNSYVKSVFVPILFLWLLVSTVLVHPMGLSSASTLMARLKLDEDSPGSEPASPNCWDSLFQLQSCSGEILLFFMNGETYLGAGCCNAIRVIQKHCWPTMLGSLGFTAEEDDTLEGYCDAAATSTYSPPEAPILNF